MISFWISSSPTLSFLLGGILGSLTRFLFGVGSVIQKSYFSSGWNPSMACSFHFVIFYFGNLSMPQVLEQSLFLFLYKIVIGSATGSPRHSRRYFGGSCENFGHIE